MLTKNKKDKIGYILIVIALLFSLLFTGGLYWQHNIITIGLLFVVSLLYFKFELNYRLIVYCFLMLLLMLVSLNHSKGDFQAGIYEVEKTILLILGCFIGTSKIKKCPVFTAIGIITFIFAAVGILCYLEFFQFDEFIYQDSNLRRLQSFIKYANTAACVLGIGYYSLLKCFDATEKRVLCAFSSVVILAFYLTISKACIPLFLMIGTFLTYREQKIKDIFIVQNLIAIVFMVPMIFICENRINLVSICLFLAYMFTSMLCTQRIRIRFKHWCLLGTVIAVLFIVVVVFHPQIFSTLLVRFNYSKDTVKYILENLSVRTFIGYGPGSWRILKYGFQSNQYTVTYLHNGFLQFVFENGILFSAILYGIIAKSLMKFYKNKHYFEFSMLLLLLMHSLFDFDLSYAFVLLIVGILIGTAYSSNDVNVSAVVTKKVVKTSVFSVTMIIIALLWFYMIGEYFYRSAFEQKYINGEHDAAKHYLLKLEDICPRDSQLQVNIAALSDGQETVQHLKNATQLSPNDPNILFNYLKYVEDQEEFIILCERYIELNPKQEAAYSNIKSLITDMYRKGKITKNTYEKVYNWSENRRIFEKVVDRNELLKDIVESKK